MSGMSETGTAHSLSVFLPLSFLPWLLFLSFFSFYLLSSTTFVSTHKLGIFIFIVLLTQTSLEVFSSLGVGIFLSFFLSFFLFFFFFYRVGVSFLENRHLPYSLHNTRTHAQNIITQMYVYCIINNNSTFNWFFRLSCFVFLFCFVCFIWVFCFVFSTSYIFEIRNLSLISKVIFS